MCEEDKQTAATSVVGSTWPTENTDTLEFVYFPAFIAEILGQYQAAIWMEHPECPAVQYKQQKATAVNIIKTPYKEPNWGAVELDDYVNGSSRGYTMLGPIFPHCYSAAGVYISIRRLKWIRENLKNVHIPNAELWTNKLNKSTSIDISSIGGAPWERMSITARRYGEIRRYHGFSVLRDFGDLGNGARLLAIAHADSSYDRRAPRILRVPEIARAPQDVIPELPKLTGAALSPIFLTREYALQVNLEVPKQPGGSGSAIFSSKPRTPRPGPGYSLNVFGYDVSSEVKSIQDALKGNYVALGDDRSLEALLRARVRNNETYDKIDFIGHTRGDGLLRLSELPLTPAVVRKLFTFEAVQALRQLGIRKIRLLGCRTAASQRQILTLSAIREQLGEYSQNVSIYTTRADIFSAHYNELGFSAEELLVSDTDQAGDVPPHPDGPPIESQEIPCPDDDYVLEYPEDLPSAEYVLTRPQSGIDGYVFWEDARANFDSLLSVLDTWIIEDNPLDTADYQVIVVTDNQVRAFELLLGSAPRIRLSFSNCWWSCAIVADANGIKQLKSLLGIRDKPVASPP